MCRGIPSEYKWTMSVSSSRVLTVVTSSGTPRGAEKLGSKQLARPFPFPAPAGFRRIPCFSRSRSPLYPCSCNSGVHFLIYLYIHRAK